MRCDVDETGVAVRRCVFVGHVDSLTHLGKGGELDLEELDGHAPHGEFGRRDDASGEERHCLDRVF